MVRPIRIAQLTPPVPNDVAPECICVPKVYDWVVISEDITKSVNVPTPTPADCPCNVTDISCRLESTPFFPISCVGEGACTILERRATDYNGANARIVKLRHEIPVSVTFTGTNAAGAPTSCTIPLTVPHIQKVILCFPDEFTSENLVCRIVSGDCTITTPPPLEGGAIPATIGVELVICIEIQVLAAVKLEVLAKFCSPRSPIPITAPDCPPLQFPQQCDLFPLPNCNCQSGVNDECDLSTSEDCTLSILGADQSVGSQRLRANICTGCAYVGSRVHYEYRNPETPQLGFDFISTEITYEVCDTIEGGALQHTIYGNGTVIAFNGTSAQDVSFQLLLVETLGSSDDQYELTLFGPGMLQTIATNTAVPNDRLYVQNCGQFPNGNGNGAVEV